MTTSRLFAVAIPMLIGVVTYAFGQPRPPVSRPASDLYNIHLYSDFTTTARTAPLIFFASTTYAGGKGPIELLEGGVVTSIPPSEKAFDLDDDELDSSSPRPDVRVYLVAVVGTDLVDGASTRPSFDGSANGLVNLPRCRKVDPGDSANVSWMAPPNLVLSKDVSVQAVMLTRQGVVARSNVLHLVQ